MQFLSINDIKAKFQGLDQSLRDGSFWEQRRTRKEVEKYQKLLAEEEAKENNRVRGGDWGSNGW